MDALAELAAAHGVAHEYWDWRNQHVLVPEATLRAVLSALDVDTSDPAAALEASRSAPWTRLLPQYLVATEGRTRSFEVHVRDGAPVEVWLELEDGTRHAALRQLENWTPPRDVAGVSTGEASFELPDDLPAGYHRLHASSESLTASALVIVTPAYLGLPLRLGRSPRWGLMTQLYSVRSRRSWGVGDLTDLAELACWAGTEHDASFVLINPLHAAEPVAPMTPSPYLPTTRRFANPLYLRVERIPEYAYVAADVRAAIERLGAAVRAAADPSRIDRDDAWTAKLAALRLLHAQPRDPGRALAYRAFCRREGAALERFATWCALVEVHGADWHSWPSALQHPSSAEVAEFAAAHGDRVDFHRWMQWQLDDQLADAQAASRRAGLGLGIVHDLAVGVSPVGADSWSYQDELARGMTVGAPPDPYAQTGQDWQQPPWRPDRLAALEFAPFRELVANALRHAGGLRVDHIIGLFRLWWIPSGAGALEGTYVRYDHEALIGILALEASRTGAVVIGEDLGTVEPWVRDFLRERGLLGTSVLWFEFDWDGGGGPLPPEKWRTECLASVTTHDLPPSAGYLAGDHVRLRHSLGLLTRSLSDELAADEAERSAWLGELRSRGLLGPDPSTEDVVVALHQVLSAAPSRLRVLSLADAVGERRTQNQPGTIDEYPNWRVPLGGPDGQPVLLEDVFTLPRAARLAEVLTSTDSGSL